MTVPSGAQLTVASGATIDVSGCTLTPPATMPASSGVNLTALNATNLGSGTVPDDRFPATLPAKSGVNLTALNATQLTSGAVPAAQMPAGTIVNTEKVIVLGGSHIYTTSSSLVASGITLATPALTGSQYNIITFNIGAGQWSNAGTDDVALYCNKNSAGYAQLGARVRNSNGTGYGARNCLWVDSAGLTAGVNTYQMYMCAASGGTYYMVHNSYDYFFIVQTVQV
jgi:hypothetical protein